MCRRIGMHVKFAVIRRFCSVIRCNEALVAKALYSALRNADNRAAPPLDHYEST